MSHLQGIIMKYCHMFKRFCGRDELCTHCYHMISYCDGRKLEHYKDLHGRTRIIDF